MFACVPVIALKLAFVFVCVCVHSCHSTKFSSKIKYVNSLDELQELIPMDNIQIPECIIRLVSLKLPNTAPPLLLL